MNQFIAKARRSIVYLLFFLFYQFSSILSFSLLFTLFACHFSFFVAECLIQFSLSILLRVASLRDIQFKGAAPPFRFRLSLSSSTSELQKEWTIVSVLFDLRFLPPFSRFSMGVTPLPVTMATAIESPFACHPLVPQLRWINAPMLYL